MQSISNSTAYLAMVVVVIGNIAGNVFLKLSTQISEGRTLIFGQFNWLSLVGAGCFAFALIWYSVALKALPLHLAQAIAILQIVGTVVAASILFGEPITILKWIGFLMICIGIVLVMR